MTILLPVLFQMFELQGGLLIGALVVVYTVVYTSLYQKLCDLPTGHLPS